MWSFFTTLDIKGVITVWCTSSHDKIYSMIFASTILEAGQCWSDGLSACDSALFGQYL